MLQCVLTDQRIKAIEQVHGYFSSEQVNMEEPTHSHLSTFFILTLNTRFIGLVALT